MKKTLNQILILVIQKMSALYMPMKKKNIKQLDLRYFAFSYRYYLDNEESDDVIMS